ncbi:hypothetical protein J2X14_000237 [Pantoea alhagi]|nr:hypothetical protein [Pantoea alhagi]
MFTNAPLFVVADVDGLTRKEATLRRLPYGVEKKQGARTATP